MKRVALATSDSDFAKIERRLNLLWAR